MKLEQIYETITDEVRSVAQVHSEGGTYADAEAAWNRRGYGWHDPCLPPEYRKHLLSGDPFVITTQADMYYFAANACRRITGEKPPCNFEIDRRWRADIRKLAEKETDKYPTEKIIGLIARCTFRRPEKRIKNAIEALEYIEAR